MEVDGFDTVISLLDIFGFEQYEVYCRFPVLVGTVVLLKQPFFIDFRKTRLSNFASTTRTNVCNTCSTSICSSLRSESTWKRRSTWLTSSSWTISLRLSSSRRFARTWLLPFVLLQLYQDCDCVLSVLFRRVRVSCTSWMEKLGIPTPQTRPSCLEC